MKKVVNKIIFVLLFMLPLFVNAASIKGVELSGTKKVDYNNTAEINITINFNDINITEENAIGILAVEYDLDFNDSVLRPIDLTSVDFKSTLTKSDNKYSIYSYVKSLVNEKITSDNACTYNKLYCSSYKSTIKFRNISLNGLEQNITVKNIRVYLIDYSDEKETYTKEDVFNVVSKVTGSYTIEVVKPSGKTNVKDDKDITSDKPNVIDTMKLDKSEIITKSTSGVPKSNNANIESITISKYELDFDKEKLEYDLEVDSETNKLNIDVVPEDTRSNILIIGAEDLTLYGGKVKIQVTAEDGTKKEYSINVTKKKEEIVEKDKKSIKEKIEDKIRENRIIGFIITGVILIIVIILIIIGSSNNKKIDKYLDKL